MLISNLNLLATAPGGVARLRELILTLAVQGKLVAQDAADEPASVLVEEIRQKKDRLISEGKIRQDKLFAAIDDAKLPFEAPATWCCGRFGELTINRDGERIPVSSSEREKRAKTYDYYGASGVIDKIDGYLFAETLLLIGEDGANLINRATPIAFLAHGKYWVNNHAHVIGTTHPAFMRYLALCINAISLEPYVTGTAQPKMNQAKLNSIVIAVPPLAEQARIVTRVEELMRLCDALEAKGLLEATHHSQLVTTLLGTLTDSASPEALTDRWQRIAEHFDILLDRPEAVDALEQTILQLAVRGLLVPQDLDDEPASVWLQAIQVKRRQLIAQGKIKQNKLLTSDQSSERPFALPEGWAWTRLSDIASIAGGATPSKAISSYWTGDIPWVSPKDMKVTFISDAQDHIAHAAIQGSLSLIPSGSLLMVVRGMILAHSFPIARTLVPVTINQDMKALTPIDPKLLAFLALVCMGMKTDVLRLIDRSTHGTCKLESAKIFGMTIPLPPLAEQARIVTRVEELRRLCADLRRRLSESQVMQAHLAEALIESA